MSPGEYWRRYRPVFIVDLVTQVNSLKPALAVMARAPVPGRVKTRLCPPLDPEQAAEFYECVMRDVLDELAPPAAWDTWVAYAERSRDYFQQLPEHRAALLPQRGASLGERMHAVFVDLCHVGYRQVILVGSDIPTLKASSVRKACDLLQQGCNTPPPPLDSRFRGNDGRGSGNDGRGAGNDGKGAGNDGRGDVVLGPADDGGYYLIGLGRPEERLFGGIAWSTASVLEQTLARARELDLRVGTVAGAYDVDVVADLERLVGDFERSPALRGRRPRTHVWMRSRLPRAAW